MFLENVRFKLAELASFAQVVDSVKCMNNTCEHVNSHCEKVGNKKDNNQLTFLRLKINTVILTT